MNKLADTDPKTTTQSSLKKEENQGKRAKRDSILISEGFTYDIKTGKKKEFELAR